MYRKEGDPAFVVKATIEAGRLGEGEWISIGMKPIVATSLSTE